MVLLRLCLGKGVNQSDDGRIEGNASWWPRLRTVIGRRRRLAQVFTAVKECQVKQGDGDDDVCAAHAREKLLGVRHC